MNPHSVETDTLGVDASLSVRAVLPAAQDCIFALEHIVGWLGQSKAYDSFYLALAGLLGVELWTSAQRYSAR